MTDIQRSVQLLKDFIAGYPVPQPETLVALQPEFLDFAKAFVEIYENELFSDSELEIIYRVFMGTSFGHLSTEEEALARKVYEIIQRRRKEGIII